jgi:pyochelin synthetase
MNATGLLQELARLGVKLSSDGENLKVKAAKGVLSVDLQKQLKAQKEEIIGLLSRSQAAREKKRLPAIQPQTVDRSIPFPLSDLQWGFYVAGDPFMEYHVRPHYYVENNYHPLDIPRYQAAWNKTLYRHRREINVVSHDPDLQLQVLQQTPTIRCRILDLRGLSADAAHEELMCLRETLKRRELPLDRWPWIELLVSLRLEDGHQKARVHYNHNNFFCDGFSMGLILSEVEGYYEDPGLQLPKLELTYRDAVLALDELAESDLGQAARDYWFGRLADLPPSPPLPQMAGLNRRCRSKLQRRGQKLSAPLWESFKAQAVRHGVTVSNAVIAAYAEILSAWSGSRHFILSQMVTRRFAEMHPEIKQILGNFASLYPLEVDYRERLPFFERARKLQEQVFRDLQHLEYGGMQVMQELNRRSGEFGSVPCPLVVGSGLFDKDYRKSDFACLETSQTLLDFQYWELSDGSLFYVWDLLEEFFPSGLIDSMWHAFFALLNQLVGGQDAWEAAHFHLLTDEDMAARRLCNQTQRPVTDASLCDHEARSRSADPALVSSQGTLSYRELHDWSLAVAQALHQAGCQKGDRVAIVADRGQELLTAAMATLRMGCVYVPMEPSLPQERLHGLLADSESTLVLTDSHYGKTLSWPLAIAAISVDKLRGKAAERAAQSLPLVRGEDLAYVIYTSGSTGRPKGVMIDHRGALNTVLDVNERFHVGPDDRIFGVSSFSFDLSVYDVFGAFQSGACLVYPDSAAALNPAHWLDVLLEHEVTIWNSVPALMRLLLETARRQKVKLPALRLVLLSGDKVPLNLASQIREVAPKAQIISMGGATEASIWSIIYPIELDADQVRLPYGCVTVPYGYPMVNQRWHVLDKDRLPCPVWVPGELYIAGTGLAKGYWHDAEKTDA